jgi:hypothetical protein
MLPVAYGNGGAFMLDKTTVLTTAERYADAVKKEFSPSAVILFGSYKDCCTIPSHSWQGTQDNMEKHVHLLPCTADEDFGTTCKRIGVRYLVVQPKNKRSGQLFQDRRV